MQPSASHQEYIRILLKDLREATRMTYRFDAKWNKVNDEINEKLARQGIRDIVQVTKIKGESIALADALGSGNWWRGKATMLAQAILAEQAAINMLGGSQWTPGSSTSSSARS